MFKRFSMVLLTLIIAIIATLVAAKYPTGPNTVSFEEPFGLMISLSMIIALFLPPLILAFFNNKGVKIIFSIYQSFIVLAFLGMIPIGFIATGSLWISVVGTIGTIVSIFSIIVQYM